MKQTRFAKFLSLAFAMFTLCSMQALAATYYSKVVATAVGEGMVCVSQTKTDAPKYNITSDLIQNSAATVLFGNVVSGTITHTYHLYAQSNKDYEFAGWYENENCSGTAVSTENYYSFSFDSGSTKSSSPTTRTYYAKFVEIDKDQPYLKYTKTQMYLNLSFGTAKNESLMAQNAPDITYTSSNERVATVAADGTVTAKKNGSCTITASYEDATAAYVLTVIDDVAAGKTQIGNGDFEDWRSSNSSNHAPDNWNSFENADASGLTTAARAQQVEMVEGGRPGSDGLYSVCIYSRSVVGQNAQGNLTLGIIKAGSTTPSNKNNHNYSVITDPAKSETIDRIPTAIKVWVKFVPKQANAEYPYARVAATVHDAYNYITYGSASHDNDANKAHAIALAERNFEACDWTELTVPFTRTGIVTEGQKYIIVNFSTNAVPGKGQSGDKLYIDDVELVYDEIAPTAYDKQAGTLADAAYTAPAATPVQITYNDGNTFDFLLPAFALPEQEAADIKVAGVERDAEGNFNFEGQAQVAGKSVSATLQGKIRGNCFAATDKYFYAKLTADIEGTAVEIEVGDDVVETTASVGSSLINTFCAPCLVIIPEEMRSSVKASTVTGVEADGSTLVLEELANGIIPAHTPVILQAAEETSFTFSSLKSEGTPQAGMLTGVYADTAAPEGSYVLQNLNNKTGFYQVAAGSEPTVKANHCYLTSDAGVKAFFLTDDVNTGIEAATAEDNATAIYNMQGMRMQRMQKGINIVNGKKVLK